MGSTKLELYWQELRGDVKFRIMQHKFYLRIALIKSFTNISKDYRFYYVS